jgi:hypothetical protein
MEAAEFAVKRFAVFSGDQYYPDGGWGDFKSSHDTLDEAKSEKTRGDWWHIVDLVAGRIVESGRAR